MDDDNFLSEEVTNFIYYVDFFIIISILFKEYAVARTSSS